MPAGTIVSWSVPSQPGLVAGDTVVPGTIVQVVVSIGAAPRTLPDFTGYSLADTRTALESAGLVLAQLPDEFSATVPVGMVVRQEPAVGQQVPAGGTVSVALSKGPDLVAVPPLADLTVAQAQAALSTAGLVLGTITGDPTGFAVLAEVDGQSIGAGAQLPAGDEGRRHVRGAAASDHRRTRDDRRPGHDRRRAGSRIHHDRRRLSTPFRVLSGSLASVPRRNSSR